MVFCHPGARPRGGPAGGHGRADGRSDAALPAAGEMVSPASSGGVVLHLSDIPRDLLAARTLWRTEMVQQTQPQVKF